MFFLLFLQWRTTVEHYAEDYLGTVIPGLENIADRFGTGLESLGDDTTATLT